jgi:signal transduction histidine kinase
MKEPQAPPRHRSLATRFVFVFFSFVAVGSIILLTWLRFEQQAEDERVFLRLAHTDADFVQRLNLPRSAKLAEDLQQLLRMNLYFRDASGHFEPALDQDAVSGLKDMPRSEVQTLKDGKQALILRLDARHDMIFIRSSSEVALSLLHPATRNALLAFWLLSAALGWIIARQVLRPVQRLTRGLETFFDTKDQVPEEAKRSDEIGELARRLTQARDDLWEEREKREQSERMALLGRVATGLAHEIKNPLASIQLHTQLMDVTALDAESAHSLKHVQQEAQTIEGLVNQWLYLTRPIPPKIQTLEITSVLTETLTTLKAQTDHAGVQIVPDFQDQPILIKGDRARLQQVFRNIILNAAQAMPRGGSLHVSLARETGQCRLQFHDEGKGFSPSALQHGAELFFSEKEGGMGVGLNVVQEIVNAHQGRLHLCNHAEGGAILTVRLPMLCEA